MRSRPAVLWRDRRQRIYEQDIRHR
ncbi:hypothetical protein GQ600_23241 [Phytophthora cactorum]|nr:hypothetical protein GQ600_23241 [Phytophthora cactorum]